MIALFFILALLPFYLIGSFPTGTIVGRSYGIRISAHGSGNTGATNVARILGRRPGLITLIADISKGFCAVGLADLLVATPMFVAAAGVAAVLGHCFAMPWLFKGGKGVATGLGVILYTSPLVATFAVIVFVLTVMLCSYVSLGSVAAAWSAPLSANLLGVDLYTTAALACIAAIITLRHQANLTRVAQGSERRWRS